LARSWALALSLLAFTTSVRADEPDHFRLGTDALSAGKFDEAIDHFEAHADSAPSHPNASYNRGLAYLTRVRANAERQGDLGRAAAAFEESLLMRPDDDEARHALELVQAEVARRRARRGDDAVLARPTLDRVIVRLASERTWAIVALVAALLLAVAIVLRRRPPGPVHLAGTLMLPTSALALLLMLPLYHGARWLRLNTQSGVVVVREAHLSDEGGASQGGTPIPEAALLEVGSRSGRLMHVRYGNREGWLPAAAVRILRAK
jgi:tetratricopeptide (TPR) repeat protein